MGRLKSLDVALALGNRPYAEAAREYEEIVRAYPDLEG